MTLNGFALNFFGRQENVKRRQKELKKLAIKDINDEKWMDTF